MEALWQRRTGKIKIGRLLADLGKSRTGNTEAVVNRQLPLTAIVIGLAESVDYCDPIGNMQPDCEYAPRVCW